MLALASFQLPVFGQAYANALRKPASVHQKNESTISRSQKENKRSVSAILFALEEAYHISFNYDHEMVSGFSLQEDFSWNKDEKLERVLKRLTQQAELEFEKVDEGNYLIYARKKESRNRKINGTSMITAPENTMPSVDLSALVQQNTAATEAMALNVSGVVRDETSNPLPGVNVMVKGTTNGTTTDSDGKYVVSVANGSDVLIFSFIGYTTQEVAVNDRTVIDVGLVPDVTSLQEVVVVGYGAQKRANVLGAVAEIKTEDVQDFPVANLATALVNRVPGVSISQASGKPGASTSIKIRNPVTFGGANSTEDPLYVIDGFQVTRQDFDNLDATQVESITFLKDAAASIYGSRGANGVVLVKTKRGAPGKAKISYQGSYALSEATRFSNMLNSYDHATLLNALNTQNNSAANTLYTEEELEYLKTHNYNWLDETWSDSHLTRHTLNVSGGSEQVTYFAGGSFYDETGNLGDLFAKKYSLRFGMNAKITDRLSANVSLSTDNAILNRPSPKGVTVQSETLSETISSLLLMPAWVPMQIDGKPVYTTVPGWHPKELQNSGSYARTKSQGVILNTSLEYKVPKIEGLTVKVQYARSSRNSFGKEYYASYDLYEFVREGSHPASLSSTSSSATQNVIFTNNVNSVKTIKNGNFLQQSHGNSANYQLNESIHYARRFGQHDLNVLLVAEQIESSGDDFNTQRDVQVIPGMDQLFAFSADKANWDNAGTSNESGRISYLGRLNYSYMDRYLLESTFRADASPHFPTNSHWGYFPSVAVGWKISEENFFRDNVGFVNDLKIRFQVGLIGRDAIANYQYKERYTQTTGMLFGATLTNGLNNNTIPNSQITWEKALYKNLGFDGTFFDRKFNFSIDLYNRDTYDMFDSPTSTVPTSFGGAISYQNYAELKSWGLEGALAYNGSVRDFHYTIGVNVGMTDNKVIKRYVSEGDAGTWRDPNGRRTDSGIEGYRSLGIVRSQEQLDAFLAEHPGYKIDGDVPKIGWVLFEDQNGDGEITDDDKVRLTGRSGSRLGIGYNLGASWKGFKFTANIAWAIGGYDTYDKPARTVPSATQSGLAHWKDAASTSNPGGKYPALDARYGSEIYDLWIVSATTMRVNNMTLSYSLPSDLTTKLRIPQLRILLTGTNLWDIINHQPYKYSATNLSTDYPAMRTYTLGVNLTL